MPVVALYASLLGLLFAVLSARTLLMRRELAIGLGDGGDERLRRAIRAHGNFAEYVPLTLFLLYLGEQTGAPQLLLHALAICLFAGRTLHAWGVSRVGERGGYRVAGMALTLTALVSASAYLCLHSL